MALEKLTPDRDLQCFFFQPSAIAALSSTSDTGFNLSGTWRQQFDWAVIEWNRDNTHEHPAFRNLPDGDLSGLTLSYKETRTNCIPLDSSLFATVEWPALRIWATPSGGTEAIYWIRLADHATAVAGSYACAYADFTLSGSLSDGDFVGLAYLGAQYTYAVSGTHILDDAVQGITDAINASDPLLKAVRTGTTVRVYYTRGTSISSSTAGTNGNRFGMYSFATGTESWDAASKTFANGTSPTQWEVTIDFSSPLSGNTKADFSGSWLDVPTNNIRKMRWTYAADLQSGAFDRSEFQVVVSDWTVTGTGRAYSVAGPGSRRFEDHSVDVQFSGSWEETRGNFSGGTIHATTNSGDSVSCTYAAIQSHTLYLGTRYLGLPGAVGASISITVDGVSLGTVSLEIDAEDLLFRYPVGSYAAGSHTITVAHVGPDGNVFYFDFLELASPSTDFPVIAPEPKFTLATDWDTEHSLALAPERTAWMLDSLGFTGRQNHYVGALWFYELVNPANVYASATVTFAGTPTFGDSVNVTLATFGVSGSSIPLNKAVHHGMTADMLALAYAIELNSGYTTVWASASGAVLTIWARALGSAGDDNTVSATATSSTMTATAAGTAITGGFRFAGGNDGQWLTDLAASPRLNRAVRDWSLSFFTALDGYGIGSTASFSMELGNGDTSATAGIAQVGPSGDPIVLPTPSVQTNFSPASLAFWQEAYLEMAGLQVSAGLTPFLQFGETQWWYFPNDGAGHAFSGMPFYDAWAQSQFLTTYGHAMATITTNTVSPASYPDEVAFLPGVIGDFTNAIMAFVRATYSSCLFEVLYPTDTNTTAFNQAINFPVSAWTPSALAVLKTENFGFTLERDLDDVEATLEFGQSLGFPATQRAHLVGVGDEATAWLKEAQSAAGKGFESVVLFALDQFCLIGYKAPLSAGFRRSLLMG